MYYEKKPLSLCVLCALNEAGVRNNYSFEVARAAFAWFIFSYAST
jgi:hypothetical protein